MSAAALLQKDAMERSDKEAVVTLCRKGPKTCRISFQGLTGRISCSIGTCITNITYFRITVVRTSNLILPPLPQERVSPVFTLEYL